MLKEKAIIHFFQQHFPVHGGIGDDAAILPWTREKSYVISKDLLVEEKHFRLSYFDPKSLAQKTLQVNLSDIAAMGAKPCAVLLGLSLPVSFPEPYLKNFLKAFAKECHTEQVNLIGGDTTASSSKLFISITVIGKVKNNQLKLNSTAQSSDTIAIVGRCGEAHLGLVALERSYPGLTSFKQAALRPRARLLEAQWLAKQSAITSMTDISDGLGVTLENICHASQRGAQIYLEALRPSTAFQAACKKLGCLPWQVKLAGGEDYSLLITINSNQEEKIANAFKKHFGYPLLLVGKITKRPGVQFLKNGVSVTCTYSAFEHFEENK